MSSTNFLEPNSSLFHPRTIPETPRQDYLIEEISDACVELRMCRDGKWDDNLEKAKEQTARARSAMYEFLEITAPVEPDVMAEAKDARLEAEEEQEDEYNTHAQYAHDD